MKSAFFMFGTEFPLRMYRKYRFTGRQKGR